MADNKDILERLDTITTWQTGRQRKFVERLAADVREALGEAPVEVAAPPLVNNGEGGTTGDVLQPPPDPLTTQ